MNAEKLYTVAGKANHYYRNIADDMYVWDNTTGEYEMIPPESYSDHQISGAYAAYDATEPISLDIKASPWFALTPIHVRFLKRCLLQILSTIFFRHSLYVHCSTRSMHSTLPTSASTSSSRTLRSGRPVASGTSSTHGNICQSSGRDITCHRFGS